MKSNLEVPENYFRVFRSMAQLIEEKLIDMEMSFLKFRQPKRVHLQYVYDIDEPASTQIKQIIFQMYQELKQFVDDYHIPGKTFSLHKQLMVQNAFLWEDLENSRSKRIRGHGAIDDQLMQQLDAFVDRLVSLSNQINEICDGSTFSTHA